MIVYATYAGEDDYVEPMLFYMLAFLGTIPLYVSHLIPGIALAISAAFFAFWYVAGGLWVVIEAPVWCTVEAFFFMIAEVCVVGFLALIIFRKPTTSPDYVNV